MKISILTNILIVILIQCLSSCVTERYIQESITEAFYDGNNQFARCFLKNIQKQKEGWDNYLNILDENTPLYDYMEISSSSDYGTYFSIPYSDKDGIVRGFIIYPIEECLSIEEGQIMGKLKTPLKLNADFLNEQIPESRRYLYSSDFLNLKQKGLKVDLRLTNYAEEMDEKVLRERDFPLTRSTNLSISELTISANYKTSSYGYLEADGGIGVTTIRIDRIYEEIIYYIKTRYSNTQVRLDGPYGSGQQSLRMKITLLKDTPASFGTSFVFYLFSHVSRVILEKYSIYVTFQYNYNFQYGSTGEVSSGGGAVNGGGAPSGGSGPPPIGDADRPKPCRDDTKGKANPLLMMRLMPPNIHNIGGATFGYTRKYSSGVAKFHQGIDLAAPPGTPIYAPFDGMIAVKLVTNQLNKVDGKYPIDYTGDINDAGNRMFIESTVNGKRILLAYWHLQAGTPIAKRNGVLLKLGDMVKAGELIGYTGITGNSDPERPHLHFGIKEASGKWIDPALYLNATISTSTTNIPTPCN